MSSEYDGELVGIPNQDLVLRDPATPTATPTATPAQSLAAHPGLGVQRFTVEQQAILERPPDPNDIDILPTGEIYYGQVQYRRRLNEAFGPGGWGLIPVGSFYQDGNETLCREYALVCEGRIVSTAIGEADFQPDNPRYSKATAAESLKSIALRRTAKDIGIADDCWDKRFIRDWLKVYAVRVWTVGIGKANKGEKKPLWRRKDGEPFDYPWHEDVAPKPVKVETTGEPIMDPNKKWIDFVAKAVAKDRKRFYDIIGGMGFEKGEEIKDRKTQIEVFKAFEGEEEA